MKSILTLVLFLVSVDVIAQTYPITSITISLPANPDASLTKWGPGTLTLSASAKMINGRIDGRVQESKILVTIKKGGSKICGTYSSNSAPASNFNTANKVWSGNNAFALLGQDCTLPPGDYELCVQFFGAGPAGIMPLSEEKCKSFSIRGGEQQTFQQPQAISPANGTVLSETDLKKPITFRWTPVIPRPRESVTYHLRVWQIMMGQNVTQAIIQPPILSNDVGNLTQAAINNIQSAPCKPPYSCDFIWNVQALNRDGKPIGSNNGTSEAFRITVNPVNDPPSILTLMNPANGSSISAKDKPKFTWTFKGIENNYSSGSNQVYKIKIVEIKGDQSPEDALRSNKPFFEKDSIERLNFQYPSSAPKFINGKSYAWIVVGDFDGDGLALSASSPSVRETFTFKIKDETSSAAVCDCGRWSPISLRTRDGIKTYECGSEIFVNCKQPFQFTINYQCSTNDERCRAKTTWEIKKGNVVIKAGTGTNNISDGFNLTENGSYTLTLNANCNDIKCKPCTYTILVRDCEPKECSCADRDKTIQQVSYNTGKKDIIQKLSCSNALEQKMEAGSMFEYAASVLGCKPDECGTTYEWKIIDTKTGAVYSNGITVTLPVKLKAPDNSGDYEFLIYPICGSKKCEPCGFKFSTFKCFKIGQNYGGGIIFYVDSTCQHGFIAAQSDVINSAPFFDAYSVLSIGGPLNVTAVGSGFPNTSFNISINSVNWYSSTFYYTGSPGVNFASALCKNLNLNGYQDWFLPSRDELNLLYLQKNVVGGFTTGEYWSSSIYWLSQSDNPLRFAWFQKFSNGNQGSAAFNLLKRVRAIRAF